jgi:ribonucleoside-diphosphate reductase alpha chain
MLTKFDHDLGSISVPTSPLGQAYAGIVALDVMPSMRCMMTAGPALEAEALCGFNCSYRAIDNLRAFDEIMYILMCGCGVGFSVERQFVGQLPIIPKRLKFSPEVINVEDSRAGWATAFRTLLERLYQGNIPEWNVDQVRPAGARLKTMGGFASGPGPLVDLFKFTVHLIQQAVGDRLNSIQCHDLVCKIGDIVVMGGVRRSALISLSNPSDMRMRHAKMGDWHRMYPWRTLANNSACYTERPTTGAFMGEWLALYDSKSGERGFVNREALLAKCAKTGRRAFWDDFSGTDAEDTIDFGCNPCAEIILRSQETCNLSEVIARPTDTIESLANKAGCAAMLGTWQATMSDYGYVGEDWSKNAIEERLLGVSTTGIMDSPILSNRNDPEFLKAFRAMYDATNTVNQAWAEVLKINPAAASTCVKPSGTVSQLVNSSSGIHARFAPFYIRRIIMDNHDPMCEFMKDCGLPHEISEYHPQANTVFAFPVRAPRGAAETIPSVPADRSAIEQLEHWSAVNRTWADHSVSCTITVDEKEWPAVGGWVWDHFDELSGVSFLPKTGSVYRQMPYEACNEDELRRLEAQIPERIDWNALAQYEAQDNTKAGHELACTGDKCEVQ